MSASEASAEIAPRLLAWFERHGRKDLPWQIEPTPYRVWVSEIMLQQTQVTTVIGYFRRFVERFPGVLALADAHVDDVLHHWSGLGYYARARNLHRAARMIRDDHGGALPTTLEAMQALPGVGRSTAGAVLALAHGERHPILDGNVKRVLARYHAVEGWTGRSSVARTLWEYADRHTPTTRVNEYTQAIMDLGATVCVRSRPVCGACPLSDDCVAQREGRQHALPAPRPRRDLPLRRTRFVIAREAQGRVLLERRPPSGIWGGLWSFPECVPDEDAGRFCRRSLGLEVRRTIVLDTVHHGFTHYRLDIEPVVVEVGRRCDAAVRDETRRWVDPARMPALGLAAPMSRLLAAIGTIAPD